MEINALGNPELPGTFAVEIEKFVFTFDSSRSATFAL